MHVDAESAAVDLRSARLDQFDQRFFETGGLDLFLQRDERFDGVGGRLVVVHPGLHAILLSGRFQFEANVSVS